MNAKPIAPAFDTRRSTGPNVASARATASSADPGAVTSETIVSQLPPSLAISAAVSLSSCSLRATATTAVPMRLSSSAKDRPSPLLPPVTMATDGACMSLQIDRRLGNQAESVVSARSGGVSTGEAAARAIRPPFCRSGLARRVGARVALLMSCR
jgi:hypothetical protein